MEGMGGYRRTGTAMSRNARPRGLVLCALVSCLVGWPQTAFACSTNDCLGAEQVHNNGIAVQRTRTVPAALPPPETPMAEAPPAVSAQTYRRRWQDFLGCAWVDYDAGLVGPCDTRDPEELRNEQDPLTLLYSALDVATIDGAGLRIQPWIQTFVGVPTLAYATQPIVNTSVNVLGLDVPVEFTAREYSFDFGDGSQPLVSSEPGAPYPDMTNFHIYQAPQDFATVTLTTTWSAKVVHPETGDAIFVTGALQTTESAHPLPVRKAKGYLTDTAEELRGR